jgi:magnesium-transporting ATPase (P-type)
MGMDPVDDAVMSRPPRPRGERVIDAPMAAGIGVIGLAMAALTLLTVDILLPGGLIEGHESLARARTAGFTVLVLAQLFNCFNARSETASLWQGLFSNRWLWSTVALSVALQVAVVHLHFLNLAFGTVPLTLAQWGLCVAMASGVLVAGELRKGLCRLAHRPPPASPLA